MRITRRPRTSTAIAAVAAAGMSLAACQTSKTPAAHVNATDLASAVKARLSNDVRIAGATNVDVDAARGLVTLSGTVPTGKDRENAGRLASSVKGVAVVYNVLEVERPSAR